MQCATTKILFKETFFEHIRGNECTLSIGKLKCCSYQCRYNTLGKWYNIIDSLTSIGLTTTLGICYLEVH